MTPQRLAIYRALVESTDHPSTENIFHRIKPSFPDIAIDTVYRTLSTFSEIGVVHAVEGYGEARRYDPDTELHHHFRCLHCSKIVDFYEDSFRKLKIPDEISQKYGVSSIKVVLEGTCDKCLKKR